MECKFLFIFENKVGILRFRLTIWNVNFSPPHYYIYNIISFRLTIWNVNGEGYFNKYTSNLRF